MLTEIPITFASRVDAQRALTNVRKRYRIALRGAVVTGPDYHKRYGVHAPLGGTGFSPAEFASALHALRD